MQLKSVLEIIPKTQIKHEDMLKRYIGKRESLVVNSN